MPCSMLDSQSRLVDEASKELANVQKLFVGYQYLFYGRILRLIRATTDEEI
jgi:hypothetical protein